MPLGCASAAVVAESNSPRRAQRADADRAPALAAAQAVDAIDVAEREQGLRDHEDARRGRVDHQGLGVVRSVGVAEGQDGRSQRRVVQALGLHDLQDLHARSAGPVVADVGEVDAALRRARGARTDGDVLGIAKVHTAQRDRRRDRAVGAQGVELGRVAGVVVRPEDAGVAVAGGEAQRAPAAPAAPDRSASDGDRTAGRAPDLPLSRRWSAPGGGRRASASCAAGFKQTRTRPATARRRGQRGLRSRSSPQARLEEPIRPTRPWSAC